MEAKTLMRAACHIVSGQSNAPADGVVQDGLVGAYILTNTWDDIDTDTMVSTSTFQDIITKMNVSSEHYYDMMVRAEPYYPDYIKGGECPKFTCENVPGKLLASILFPFNFCYERYTETNERFPKVIIEDGILLPDSGPLCKKTIGAKSGCITHILWKDYSPEVACKFLSDMQKLIDYWLPHHGFSMGISDCLATSKKMVAKELVKMQSKVDTILNKCDGIPNPKEEEEINGVLNSAMNVGLKLAKTSMAKGERNALNIMRTAGAKGSVVNLSQITSHVGQQNIGGGRIPPTLCGGTRCLPHFEENDHSPEARGFIDRSYLRGLTPSQAFFHAAAGREGIISTALKTADTGYEQKKVCRKLEDLVVKTDLTVRDANDRIVQFMYGDDGMDPKKILSVKGVDHPFFVNVHSLALRLNSDAKRNGDPGKMRKLREKEKKLLLTFIQAGSPMMKTEVVDLETMETRKILYSLLKDVKLYECKIATFCSEVRNIYERSKAQEGDAVGLVATSSIGEPATQLTLNTFHNTGLKGKDVSLGVPRLRELFNATKSENQKKGSCTIYFSDSDYQQRVEKISELNKQAKKCKVDSDKRQYSEGLAEQMKDINLANLQPIINNLPNLKVSDLLSSFEMKYLSKDVDVRKNASPIDILTYEEYEPEWWVPFYQHMEEVTIEPEHWVLVLKFDLDEMFRYDVSLEDIANIINEASEEKYVCIHSPNIDATIHVYCNFSDIQQHVASNFELPDGEAGEELITSENVNFFTCRDVVVNYIKSLVISGIDGVKEVFPREEGNEWVIDVACDPVNNRRSCERFLNILNIEGVDQTRTICDDVHAIFSVLGIEAARKFLIEELTRVLSFDGTYIDQRHIQILIDSMTHTGDITSVGRYGISRDAGPVAKIMFEQSVANAIESSAFTELDKMNSMASSVMYGTKANSGTGVVNIDSIDKIRVSKRRKFNPQDIIDDSDDE